MEVITFLLLIILLILIITISTNVNNLNAKVEILQKQIKQYKDLLGLRGESATKPTEKETNTATYSEKVVPLTTPIAEQHNVQHEIKKEAVTTPAEVVKPAIHKEETIQQTVPVTAPKPEPFRDPLPVAPKQSFFDKNPDLEKFIGENLMNKIGIGILVLGIGFFVKYAISQGWISVELRTAIGILCGGILIGVAHKLRKTFAAFSSVLVGGGLAVLYFTISIAFHEYHVFSQTVAFVIMVLITSFAVLLAISYDRKELAILAIIGGFTSPFLLSTGAGNYVVLFTYVTILNVGMLALAYFKKWNAITVISYIFTIILFGGWVSTKVFFHKDGPYVGALIFGTIFYLLFFLMNIINNVKEKRGFNSLEITLLLSNTFLYFAVGLGILSNLDHGYYNGLFTLLVAVFNFVFAYSLYKNDNVDINLVYLLIGFVLTFLSLAAPIQLEGNQITLFWSAEAVLLLWLSQKSGIHLLKKASILILVLMLSSLVLDWKEIYYNTRGNEVLTLLLNKGFITGIFSITSLFLTMHLLKNETEKEIVTGFEVSYYKQILSIAFIIALYTGLLLELRYQLHHYIYYYATNDIILGSYNLLFLLLLSIDARKKEIPVFLETTVLLSIAAIIAYPLFYHFMTINVRNSYIHGHGLLTSYIYHYINALLVLALLQSTYKNMQSKGFILKDLNKIIVWFCCFIVLFIASSELDHIMALADNTSQESIREVINQNHKIGYPILWGISSFILMIIGMKVKSRDLRIISLTLFLIIILKLFMFDIRGISEGGKIAAFIFLGVILLSVSFMYQKLKNLILVDDSQSKSVREEETKTEKE